MKRILFVTAIAFILCPGLSAQSASEDAAANASTVKARAAIQAMVQALGGQAWLTLRNSYMEGRTSGYYQGKPTGAITDFYVFHQFPDKDRIELTKKRNVVNIYDGNQAWEITYRGKRPIEADISSDFLRRRDHSIETAVRVWMKDPRTLLTYDGQKLAERHLADQVTFLSTTNDSITILMDADTHLPLRCSFEWRDPVYKDKNEDAIEYDDYHTIQGFPTAFTVTRFHNGDVTNQRFIYKASYNFTMPPDAFNADATAAKIKK